MLELTPKQNYPECDNWNKTPFTNPLVGSKKTVTVHVDNEDPVVICGFHNILDHNPRIHIDGKTLFHYTGKLVAAEESPLEPSSLFYKVTVSAGMEERHFNNLTINHIITLILFLLSGQL